ncbi:MAG: hypothetical protein ACLP50_01995 [Solirubrobacteraceae bacterium]
MDSRTELGALAGGADPDLSVLHMSGYLQPPREIGDGRPDHDRLITKPFTPDGLLAGIRDALPARAG